MSTSVSIDPTVYLSLHLATVQILISVFSAHLFLLDGPGSSIFLPTRVGPLVFSEELSSSGFVHPKHQTCTVSPAGCHALVSENRRPPALVEVSVPSSRRHTLLAWRSHGEQNHRDT